MKVFVIADLHLFHENIIKYENRPFTNVDDMNKSLIKNWNKVVSNDDKVFVLGDVTFGNKEQTAEIIKSLHGKKILVMGNHDISRNIKWFLDVGFDGASRYPIIYNEFIVLMHEPPCYYNDASPYFYIYGHVHSCEMYKTITKQSACVSVERWDYTPVDIDKIFDLVKLV